MRSRIRQLIVQLIPSSDSVLERGAKSGIWVTGIKVGTRALQIILLIVLARLLTPEDFGLMGIALLTLGASQQFTKIGLNAALIQQKAENVDDYLDTTWVLEVARGLLIFGVLFVAAPYIAAFFSEPRATWLIRVIGLSPLLYGMRNPGAVYFKKDLEFHKEFALQTSGSIAQFVVGVTYALISPTVWALVLAFVAADMTRFALSYRLHPYRPWPAFDVEAAKELINYGKWITGTSIIYWLYSQGDDAFVGWYLSATALGFYQYAYQLADIPASEVSEAISSVTFPAYSKLQEQPQQLKNALLGATRITTFVTFPMAFGIALVAPSFVPVVLGPEWTPMIVVLQLLALYGLLHSMTRNFGSIWKAIGRPDVVTKLGVLRVLCIAALIWPATAAWGIEGTAAVVVGVYFFPMLPLDVYMLSKMTVVKQREIYREYLLPFIPAAIMFGSLWYARGLVDVPAVVELVVLVPAGGVIYLLGAYATDQLFDWGIKRNVRSIVGGIKA